MQSCSPTLDIGLEVAQRCEMQTVTYTQAKRNLNAVIDMAIDERAPVLITQRGAPNVVMISAEEWEAIGESIVTAGETGACATR